MLITDAITEHRRALGSLAEREDALTAELERIKQERSYRTGAIATLQAVQTGQIEVYPPPVAVTSSTVPATPAKESADNGEQANS